MLTAQDVAAKIRERLTGALSEKELSDWALQQFVREDAGPWYAPKDSRLLKEAIRSLIFAPEEQFELGGDELETLARSLEERR